jgi:hypothetical protein
MKHLLSFSVFQPLNELTDGDFGSFLGSIGCDGLELFTLYDEVPKEYYPYSPSVHLPYAVDWYRGWTGQIDRNRYSRGDLDYITYGVDREEIVINIRRMIDRVVPMSPAYGVLHAGNTDMSQVFSRHYSSDDRVYLEAFAEMVNAATADYKGGEPPIMLAFENLWWSGLKLREPWEYKLLEDKVEFDNWCFCLDTGHMMNTLPDAYDEGSAIEGVMRIVDRYPQDMRDRIKVMHFHYSASAEYRHSFEEKEVDTAQGYEKLMGDSYEHVGHIDQHRPYTDRKCLEIVDAIRPDYLTHEMLCGNGRDYVADFIKQRSLFEKTC